MVEWAVKFSKRAEKDARMLKSAHLDEKAKRIIAVVREDPFGTPPPFEKLRADLKGMYSRRINLQHRLVYEVRAEDRAIIIFSMYHHYDD